MLILDSHEFIDFYRGDKDVRLGLELVQRYGYSYVILVPSVGSPADQTVGVGDGRFDFSAFSHLPREIRIRVLPSRSFTFNRGAISIARSFRLSLGQIGTILEEEPDVVFENVYTTFTPRMYQTGLASWLGSIPLIYIDAGDIPSKGVVRRAIARLEALVVAKSCRVIVYNDAAKQRFVAEYDYPADRIDVIPKPVDTDVFYPSVDASSIRSRFNLESRFVVAYFGRLAASKGYQYLLEAARILRDSEEDQGITFIFVGPSNQARNAEHFRSLIGNPVQDNILLTGMLPHDLMPQAYAVTDVVVFPDVTKPPAFTTVLAESMASGRAIVIGNQGWETATPIVNGVNGLVIPPRDSIAISRAILYLKQNESEAKRMGSEARRYAISKMDWSVVAQEFHEIISATVNQGER